MKKVKSRCIVFLSIFVLLFQAETLFPKPKQKSFLWKVQSKTSELYLMGSIHVANESMYPLNPAILRAFKKSKILVVEVDITKIGFAEQMTLVMSSKLPAGKTLKDFISKETYNKTAKELKNQGVSISALEHYKPWMVAGSISALRLRSLGYKKALGIDLYFIKKAQERKMKILELERAKDQINALNSLSYKTQEEFLKSSLEDRSELRNTIKTLAESWQKGDIKKFQSAFDKSFKSLTQLKPLYDNLFTKRNKKMLKKIEGYLKQKEIYFVVVGSGHLIGKDGKGIIRTLKSKGYSVKQL